jgi:hypothetical protein
MDNVANGSNYLRSKREICRICNQREDCARPCKDTEDEDTFRYNCDKYKK